MNQSRAPLSNIQSNVNESNIPSKLTLVKVPGSSTVQPLTVKSRKRLGSLDMHRVVTKESTVLFRDIYENIQSTLKKYDELVRENEENKIKNDSMRCSGAKSPCNSNRRSQSRKGETCYLQDSDSNKKSETSTLEAAMRTLQEQQRILILMLQNNSVQEALYQHLNDQSRKLFQQKFQLLDQVRSCSPTRPVSARKLPSPFEDCITDYKFALHSHRQMGTQNYEYITPGKHIPSISQFGDDFDLERTPKVAETKPFSHKTTVHKHQQLQPPQKLQREPIEIQLKKGNKQWKAQSSQKKKKDVPLIIVEQPKTFQLPDEQTTTKAVTQTQLEQKYKSVKDIDSAKTVGYAAIHSKKNQIQHRNQLWKDKVVEKIRTQKEQRKQEEMKQCTFQPKLNSMKSISNHQSENCSDYFKDLREIVSLIDEFQEFKKIIDFIPK